MFVKNHLRIADCGLTKPNPKSEIQNPKSGRRALSLTEVLIAMGILTVGLLGVAAVFPVGSFYMQKADIADRGSAIAQSVMNDLVARGMLNPRAWYVMVPNPRSTGTGLWNTGFTSDGANAPGGAINPSAFTRPFAAALSEALTQPAAATDPTVIAKQFGNAYVIDPLGLAFFAISNAQALAQPAAHGPATAFPATGYTGLTKYANNPGWPNPAWRPWLGTSSASTFGYMWPVRRVTFRQTSNAQVVSGVAINGAPLDAAMAEHYFRGSDDLASDLPQRDDRPAIQKWDMRGQTPLARQWVGDYSWIVTVVPTTNAARDGLARNPEGYAYDVSVVVFYKRLLPDPADIAYPILGGDLTKYVNVMSQNERAVTAGVVSTGLNGGELLLTSWGDVKDGSGNIISPAGSEFEQLRTGQWIMLCGPHPNSNVNMSTTPPTGEMRFALNWYQVLSIEPAVPGIYGYDSAKQQRVVALRGPQWPWQPSTDPKNVANDLCVAICKGAVAVHSKTMRLEGHGSAWSVPASSGSGGDGGFGNAGDSTTTQAPFSVF